MKYFVIFLVFFAGVLVILPQTFGFEPKENGTFDPNAYCNIQNDVRNAKSYLTHDEVIIAFLEKFPNAYMVNDIALIQPIEPPQTTVFYHADDATLAVRIVEHNEKKCFVPFEYRFVDIDNNGAVFYASEKKQAVEFFIKKLNPLKQFDSGVPLNEIQCKESLVLIQKHDGSPACVKPETVPKLIERGWGKNHEDKITMENYKIDCNDQMNPYQEYECFKNAYSNCQIATVNPEIYTIEGDPVYTILTITSDCKIQGMADMSTDRFWGTPEIITTKCDTINRDEYTWSVKNCDADKLPEMQFNFEMQLYPQILECEENGNTWNREKLECVVNEENEN